MQFRTVALAAVLAATPFASALSQTSLAVLQGARIVSPGTVDVTQPPAAVTLEISATSPVGLSAVAFSLRSPSGHQTIGGEQSFTDLPTEPTSFDGMVQTVFGGGGLHRHGLNLYSEPGTWSLASITACDTFRRCAITSGAALAALVSPLTVTVVNNGSPVTALPVIRSAQILTPSLQQTSPLSGLYTTAPFQVALDVSDVAPGIVQAQATFAVPLTPPFNINSCTGHATLTARAPELGVPATSLAATLSSGTPACANATDLLGTYTLTRLTVADEAGNVLDIRDPARLKALFPAGTTVTVTQ